MKTWIAVLALAVAFAMPSVATAHEGHTHKILGTVTSADDPHFDIKTADGKTVVVMIDASTAITRGKDKADVSALKEGVRVSIDAMQEKDMMMAKAIRIGVAKK